MVLTLLFSGSMAKFYLSAACFPYLQIVACNYATKLTGLLEVSV